MQYEIIAGGAGARATKDGASGITVNQSNAMIAPIEIIESEFPTRLVRFELIKDSGGAGHYRGGLGIRREYLNLEDARFSIRSMKHVIPPNGCAGGMTGRPGDIWINPDGKDAEAPADALRRLPAQEGRRLPARHARAAAATAMRVSASPRACSTTCARASCRPTRRNATTAWCSSATAKPGASTKLRRNNDA